MDHDIDVFAKNYIYQKSILLTKTAQRADWDREDVVSELTLHLLRRRDQFNPGRGSWTTFVKAVVNNRTTDLHHQLSRQRATLSLSDPRVSRVAERLEDIERLRHHGVSIDPESDQCDRTIDLNNVLSQIPQRDRRLCDQLSRFRTADAAKHLNQCRSNIYRRIVSLRKEFSSAGLTDYWK
ncbi:sigma factor [Thalassoglobus sp.]|uniref:sigma factor n=1 Tax=Thalassoglobus sp. TaxID=2795869 RepID=UPI003AA9619F